MLTPQPRSFLRELPTLGAFWLFTLHQSVLSTGLLITRNIYYSIFSLESTKSFNFLTPLPEQTLEQY